MAHTRERAVEIKREGAIRRRNWSPRPGSLDLKVYRYWERRSRKHRTRENFCHYWRVVLIWGPAWWLGALLRYLIPGVAVVGIAALVIHYKLYTWQLLLGLVCVAAGVGYLLLCIGMCMHVLYLLMPSKVDPIYRLEVVDGNVPLTALAVLLTSPVLVLMAALAVVVVPIAILLLQLSVLKRPLSRLAVWFCTGTVGTKWIRPWMAGPLAVLVLSPWQHWARATSTAMVGLACVVGVVLLLSFWADRSRKRWNEEREAKQLENLKERNGRLLTARHSILLQRMEVTANYLDWLEEYRAWFKRRYGIDALEAKVPDVFLSGIESEFMKSDWAVILDPDPVKPPNIVRRVMAGLADYLVLIWSVVLVNKWKTCPLVELPRD